jgi:uncharacterized protein YjbJ (UPF0337 family)
MTAREVLEGHWNEVAGRLKDQWAQLTDDDLRRAKGSAERLVGVVQEKTGATRREIENFLTSVLGSENPWAAQIAQAAQQYALDASEYLQDSYRKIASQTRDYSVTVQKAVRARPVESLAIALGIGIAAGAFLYFGRRR